MTKCSMCSREIHEQENKWSTLVSSDGEKHHFHSECLEVVTIPLPKQPTQYSHMALPLRCPNCASDVIKMTPVPSHNLMLYPQCVKCHCKMNSVYMKYLSWDDPRKASDKYDL